MLTTAPGDPSAALSGWRRLLVAGSLALACGLCGAQQDKDQSAADARASDEFGVIESLGTPSPHWIWVIDPNFIAMPDGRATLFDADSGSMLGTVSTGFSFNAFNFSATGGEIYSAETYYARHTRGARTDVVTIYDPIDLVPVSEIEIPAKRASTITRLYNTALTDDGRYLAVFNLTPARSLSIVDVRARRFVGEIDTPGCVMAYPAGPARFMSLCEGGTLLLSELNADGTLGGQRASPKFFDPVKDPILEHAVRDGDQWLFVSVEAYLQPVDLRSAQPQFGERWSLVGAEERAAQWRPGGIQVMDLHTAGARLYVLMHQGDFFSYEEPGTEVWVFDVQRRVRTAR
ncbi:MAG: amine dehydrogenase, partial [Gammaproteobacteria bacterium]|nr:amine dehydrogenase [Gammaproteobacteria bacterium]